MAHYTHRFECIHCGRSEEAIDMPPPGKCVCIRCEQRITDGAVKLLRRWREQALDHYADAITLAASNDHNGTKGGMLARDALGKAAIKRCPACGAIEGEFQNGALVHRVEGCDGTFRVGVIPPGASLG